MKTGTPPSNWDEQLQQKGGNILQSRGWAEFQHALGHQPVWDSGDGYQWMGSVWESRGLRYLVCSYGPVVSPTGDPAKAIQSIIGAARELGLDFVRLDPRDQRVAEALKTKGGRRITDNQPARTQIIDLTKDMEELRKDLASGHRNGINGTERRGIEVSQVNRREDLEELLKMLGDTAKRSGTTFQDSFYFQSMWSTLQERGVAKLYMATVDKQPVAAAIFFDWGDTRSYLYAGAWQDKNREVKASVSLVWQAVVDAKQAGLKRFDLWGIAPTDDPKHAWAGITKFKKGFGGESVSYPGTYDIPLKPQKYRLYSVYRRLRGRQ